MVDDVQYGKIRTWFFLAFLLSLGFWVVSCSNHALDSSLAKIDREAPASASWLARQLHSAEAQLRTGDARLAYAGHVFFGILFSPLLAWLLAILCARLTSVVLDQISDVRDSHARARSERRRLAEEQQRLAHLSAQSAKLQSEQDVLAGRQILAEHLRSIRRTLGYLADGQELRIGAESINEYLDKIQAEPRISQALKREGQVRADVGLLLEELKRLKLHNHLVGKRMKQIFK
jgi:hypothetical protein